jgi:hypothetical protein
MRLVYFAVCIALMLGFFIGLRWLVFETPGNFGIGLGLGLAAGVFIGALGERISRRGSGVPH